MPRFAITHALPEAEFAKQVNNLAVKPSRRDELLALLREDHPVYDQRGAAAVVRMRGWILNAISRSEVGEAELLFILEELDTGRDPYLVAAACRALRVYPQRRAAFAPFLMRSLNNIRYHDEPVCFGQYGEYATAGTGITPVREILATLKWLGPAAAALLPDLNELHAKGSSLSKKTLTELDATIRSIEGAGRLEAPADEDCCSIPFFGSAASWKRGARRTCERVESIRFQDQDGIDVSFAEFFRGQPSIVVFFYTRCDNPQKCSLTVAKLARIQTLLAECGLAEQIRTAAVTYDPSFDGPERIRGYGNSRGVRFATGHRLFCPTQGIEALRNHFKLGVNFVESLVNRHRIEVYLLDAAGAIAASYERIHWSEQQIVDHAAALLKEERAIAVAPSQSMPEPPGSPSRGLSVAGAIASVGYAFFPKCPFCWAAYLSVFGIAGLEQIPYSPWLKQLFVVLMLLNVFCVWIRARTTRRVTPFVLVSAGAVAILVSRTSSTLEHPAAWLGVGLSLAGSFLSAAQTPRRRVRAID